MKQSHQRLLDQFLQMAQEGAFGDEIKASQAEYDSLPKGIATSLKVVHDFRQATIQNEDLARIRETFFQLIIVSYREARRVDPDIALSIVNSLIDDYPGVSESCLLTKWCSLSNASLAFREVSESENRLLIWQQTCKLFQAYSEFLNGLLSYLIISWRTAKSKPVNTSVFSVAYSNKIEQLKTLTGGENGAFELIFRIAHPRLRNATAHETIWVDYDADKVRYSDGKPAVEYELGLADFFVYCLIGSHLAQPYLAALAVIVVMEKGTQAAKSLIPQDLVRLFNFVPKNAS